MAFHNTKMTYSYDQISMKTILVPYTDYFLEKIKNIGFLVSNDCLKGSNPAIIPIFYPEYREQEVKSLLFESSSLINEEKTYKQLDKERNEWFLEIKNKIKEDYGEDGKDLIETWYRHISQCVEKPLYHSAIDEEWH